MVEESKGVDTTRLQLLEAVQEEGSFLEDALLLGSEEAVVFGAAEAQQLGGLEGVHAVLDERLPRDVVRHGGRVARGPRHDLRLCLRHRSGSSLRGSLHGHGTATQQGFDNPPQRDRLDPFEEVCVNQVLELVNKLIDVYDGTHVDPNIARLDRPGQRVNLDRQISLLFTRIEQEPHPQFHYELVDRLWRKSKASHYALQRLVKLNMVQVESVLQEHISREASVQNASVQNVEQTRATETLSRYYREHQFFGKAADFMLYMARRPPPPSINEEYDGNSLSPDFAITARLDFFGQCDGSLKQSYRTEAQGAHATVDKHKLRSYFELAKIQWDLYSDLMKDHEDGNHQINPSDEMKRDEHTAGRFAHMIIVDICDRDPRQMRKDYTDLVDR
jgi:hypothetical protein